MVVQFLSVHLSVTSNRQMDKQKIIEGERADGLTITQTERQTDIQHFIVGF